MLPHNPTVEQLHDYLVSIANGIVEISTSQFKAIQVLLQERYKYEVLALRKSTAAAKAATIEAESDETINSFELI